MNFIKNAFKAVLISLLATNIAWAGNTDTALKLAFQQSRAEKNIDIVLPVFLKSRLYIVTHSSDKANDYYLVASPDKSRMCVTVAEDVESLQKIKFPKVEITGEQLIKSLSPEIEIVIVYKDGGDYIPREQLQWYRGNLR